MEPLTHTAVAVTTDARNKNNIRYTITGKPKARASVSPRTSTFRCRPSSIRITLPVMIGPTANRTWSQRRKSRPPTIQNRNSRNRYSLIIVKIPDVKAPRSILTATPASNKVVVSNLLLRKVKRIVIPTDTKAPTKAKAGM